MNFFHRGIWSRGQRMPDAWIAIGTKVDDLFPCSRYVVLRLPLLSYHVRRDYESNAKVSGWFAPTFFATFRKYEFTLRVRLTFVGARMDEFSHEYDGYGISLLSKVLPVFQFANTAHDFSEAMEKVQKELAEAVKYGLSGNRNTRQPL